MGMVVRECVPAERVEPATSVVGCDPLTGLADRSVLLSRMASLLGGIGRTTCDSPYYSLTWMISNR